ncbi:MAG: AAA family ATPase [Elusimicrobia bacterium CG1_02_63_36]|nr:MAG: AAA family ATPase [Elusimicrobia bacterium CG1_02_63_36]
MDPLRNPFSPGAGNPPPELAGRDELLEQARITLGRVIRGRYEQSLMLVGLRGVGKTVLLNRIREIAEGMKYQIAMIEATESRSLPALLIPTLRAVLIKLDRMEGISTKAKLGLRVLRSFVGALKVKLGDFEVGLDVDPEEGKADSGDFESDLSELFQAIGEAAQDRDTAVAVIVDEIQYLDEAEMSALIMAIHRVSQRQLPLVLIAAGLPQLVGLAGRSKSYAERLFQFPAIGPLDEAYAMAALRDPVHAESVDFTDNALREIIHQTEGYPYFLQEWGYQSWNLAAASPIDKDTVVRVAASAIKKLDASFFRVRFDRLTPREKEYLRALAELGPGSHRSGDAADILGVRVASIAPLRSGLIRKGMVYSPAHGDTAFTVPLFDDFMRRTMPDWKNSHKKRIK